MHSSTPALLSGAAVLLLPFAAIAQDAVGFEGNLSLGYSMASVDDVDVTTLSLGLESELTFTENFSLGFDLDVATADSEAFGLDISADFMRMQLEPTYHFGNGAYAGLYYQMAQIDLASPTVIPAIGISVELNSYGLFGGYEQDNWWAEAYIGRSDTDPGLPGDVDISDYGLSGGYAFGNGLELYGTYAVTSIDGLGADVDASLFALGAEYDFDNGLGIYGAAGRLDVSAGGLDADATQFALGASYDLAAAGLDAPVVLSAELARTQLDLGGFAEDDINTFSLSVSIPIGGGASTTPANGSSRIARGDIRSAVVAGLGGAL